MIITIIHTASYSLLENEVEQVNGAGVYNGIYN